MVTQGPNSLASTLQHLNHLSELDLRCNKIGDEGALSIARATSRINGLKLRIWNHRISKKGSSDIASLIENVDKKFHHLTINSELIEEMNLLLLNMQGNGIESNYIEHIELNINGRERFDLKVIPKIIKHCSLLHNLDISCNGLFVSTLDLMVTVIIECLQHCHSLQTLNLSQNEIGLNGAEVIAEGLQHCRSCRH